MQLLLAQALDLQQILDLCSPANTFCSLPKRVCNCLCRLCITNACKQVMVNSAQVLFTQRMHCIRRQSLRVVTQHVGGKS
jgi:hypothetical protein